MTQPRIFAIKQIFRDDPSQEYFYHANEYHDNGSCWGSSQTSAEVLNYADALRLKKTLDFKLTKRQSYYNIIKHPLIDAIDDLILI